MNIFLKNNIVDQSQCHLIKSSGVDMDYFKNNLEYFWNIFGIFLQQQNITAAIIPGTPYAETIGQYAHQNGVETPV